MIRRLGIAMVAAAIGCAAAEDPPGDAAEVETLPLVDPLVLADGSVVETAEDWRDKRRPELLELFAANMHGRTPIGRPDELRFVVREEIPDARDGKATRLRVGILFEGREGGRRMELLLHLPNQVEGPVPVFFGLNFDGNFTTTAEDDLPVPEHYVQGLYQKVPDHRADESMRGCHAAMWPHDAILARGYGLATACYGEVEPDLPRQWWHGPRVLAPPGEPDSWGAIGGWAWAMSRAMDYLETHPRVDAGRVAAVGFSRLGKTTLWAAAQDERFAAVVSQNSGKGGVSLSKRISGERVSNLTGTSIGHWFCPRYRRFADNEAALPVDGNCLAALIAPRPLLILSASEDGWSDPEGEFLSGVSAGAVYELLGHEGLRAVEWPEPGVLVDSRIGYYLRRGKHNVTPEDWRATLDWADRHLKR